MRSLIFSIKVWWRTIHLYLTELVVGEGTVSIWQWSSPVVVINDVSPMFDTSYVCRIRYCGYGIAVVLETKSPILFLGGIWYVYRESEKSSSITIVLIYLKASMIFKKNAFANLQLNVCTLCWVVMILFR